MFCSIYEVIVKIIGKGTKNQLREPRGSIKENLTGYLQRDVVFRYEKIENVF
jgi:hypothetical protein